MILFVSITLHYWLKHYYPLDGPILKRKFIYFCVCVKTIFFFIFLILIYNSIRHYNSSAQALSSVNRLVAGIPPSLLANDTFYQNLNRVLFGLLETQDLRRLMAHEATRTPLLGTFLALGRIKRGFLDHPFFEQVVQGGARVQPLGQLFIALAAALHAEAERDDVDLNSIGLGGRALRYVRQFCRANAKDASVGVVCTCSKSC